MLKRLLVGVSFLVLGAFGLQAQSEDMPASQEMGQQQMSDTDREFISNAYQSNLKEIQLGQLAEQQASSDEVKQYAREVVADHTRANDELQQIANANGIDLPSDVPSTEQEQFSGLSGTEFDRQFLQHQQDAHRQAISMYEQQASQGQDPELKAFASNQLDSLREHENKANTLMASLSTSPQRQGRAATGEQTEESMTRQEETRTTTTTTEQETQQQMQLPRTASPIPLVGLSGLLLIGAGLVFRLLRK